MSFPRAMLAPGTRLPASACSVLQWLSWVVFPCRLCGKVLMLKRVLESAEDHEYVVWLDGDAAILDHNKSLSVFIHQACMACCIESGALRHVQDVQQLVYQQFRGAVSQLRKYVEVMPEAKGRHLILQEDCNEQCCFRNLRASLALLQPASC